MEYRNTFVRINLFLLILTVFNLSAIAGNKSYLTYHGRITKTDGTVVSAASVSMAVQILGPDGCLLWQETLPAQNFSSSKGTFTVNIGSGANTAAGALTWDKVFQNGVALGGGALTGTGCSGTFNGAATDDRTLYMTFNDGSGNQTVGPVAVKSVTNNAMLNGFPVVGAPAGGETLAYNALGYWEPSGVGAGDITSVTAGTGLTGGSMSGAATLDLANIASNTVLANTTGGAAAPVATSLTALLDVFSSTRGSILYRGAGGWVALAPGTSGDFLKTQGAGADPVWATVSGGGSGTVNAGTINQLAWYSATGSAVSGLATANNSVLKTNGTGVPSWGTLASTDMPTYAINSVMITNASGTLTAGGGTTANTILQGSVTGPVWSTATYPSTTTANQLLYSSAGDTVSGLATANNGVLITSAGGVPSISSTLPSAVTSNITSVGTVTSGTWNGTAIGPTYGGTGQTTYATGDLLYASAANTLSKLAAGTNGHVLTLSAGVPVWQAAAGGGGALSSITAAAATNSIDNLNFGQTWNWSTATTQNPMTLSANALTTGSLLNVTSSYASGNSTNGLLYVANTGAVTNGTIARIQSNSTAGSGLTVLASGNVGIGTSSPGATLHVAGTMRYVDGNQAAGKVLQSDASGNATWQTLGGSESTAVSNVGAGGVGVYRDMTGSTINLKTINAATSAITITNDGANNEIDIGVNTELAGLSGLASTGFVKRTGAGTYSAGTAASLTADVSGVLPLANGGTNANLTAVNGGVVYSSGTAMGITVAGSSGQMMRSNGAAAPTWSTATYPNTTTINQLLYSSAGDTVSGLATANNGVLITSAGGVPSISSTIPNATQDNITRLGTVTSGTWNSSTAIGAAYGGTGQTSYTVGDILYASGASALSKLAAGTSAYVLTSNGPGVAPSWQAASGGLSGLTSGRVTLSTGATSVGDSANFTFNSTTGALGINGTTPAISITGNGTISSSGTLTVQGASGSATTIGNSGGASSLVLQSGSGNISLAGSTSVSGANTFATGTGAVSLNGDTTIAAGKNLALASGVGVSSQAYTGTASAHTISANSLTSGNILSLTSTSTAAAAGNTGLNIAVSGANGTASITRYGLQSAVTATGTTNTNVAAYLSASGGSTANYGLIVAAGSVGIGTTTPVDTFSIGTAPVASATRAVANLSNTALSGGSANGTYLGINPAAFTGNFIDVQIAGARKFLLDYLGYLTATRVTISDNTITSGGACTTTGQLARDASGDLYICK